MAKDTSVNLRNQVMYSVFVRNYSKEGTFAALEKDLDRIKNLGVDIIWLMPIHPIGEKARKGTLGSPYANKDYREVNPEFGTRDDLESLVEAIHKCGMKCIILPLILLLRPSIRSGSITSPTDPLATVWVTGLTS